MEMRRKHIMNKDLSRREFMKLGSAGLVVGLTPALHAHASASQAKPLRVGFIGTGGRGTGVLGEMTKQGLIVISRRDQQRSAPLRPETHQVTFRDRWMSV